MDGLVNSSKEYDSLMSDLRRHRKLSAYQWDLTKEWKANGAIFSVKGVLENDSNDFVFETEINR